MNNIIYKILGPVLTLTVLAIFSGCVKNDIHGEKGGSDEMTIKWSVSVPMSKIPSTETRAMQGPDENHVQTLDVLAFTRTIGETSTEQEFFAYHTVGYNIKNVSANKEEWNFEASILPTAAGKEVRFVVLANLRKEIAEELAKIQEGQVVSRKVLLEKIVFNANAVWDTSVGNVRYLPMWGETSNGYKMVGKTFPDIEQISLMRAVARVDIGLHDPANIPFKINKIVIHNAAKQGLAAPHPDNVVNKIAVTPTLPEGYLTGNSDKYTDITYELAAEQNAFLRDIYIAEAKNKQRELSEVTCVLIQGTYSGPGAANKATWYRIDFVAHANGTETQLDILRNYFYRINITDVLRDGYNSMSDAASHPADNSIITDITFGDNIYVNHVTWNGRYMLGVSEKDIVMNAWEQEGYIIRVKTNYPGGWTWSAHEEPLPTSNSVSWLYASDYPEPDRFFLGTHEYTGNGTRTGYIIFKAGTELLYAVKVTQDPGLNPTLKIVDANGEEVNELLFKQGDKVTDLGTEKFYVKWMPENNDVAVSLSNIGRAFNFGSGDRIENGDVLSWKIHEGERMFEISPDLFTDSQINPAAGGNPFLEESTTVKFSIGGRVSKEVKLTQRHYDMISYEYKYGYLLDGSTHAIKVRTNVEWSRLTVMAGEIIDNIVTTSFGVNDEVKDVEFRFKAKNQTTGNNSWYDTPAWVRFNPIGSNSSLCNNKEIYIRGFMCGRDNNALAVWLGENGRTDNANMAGKSSYLTHMYGDRCWMVQNSMEGTPVAKMYDDDPSKVNGYYYLKSQAKKDACPDGWRLPDYADSEVLRPLAEGAANKSGAGKWWINASYGAAAGQLMIYDSSWYGWGSVGYWFLRDDIGARFYAFTNSASMSYDGVGYQWNSVRCIFKKHYDE